jgi:3-hydroxyisobutyrate dehydrogenase
MSGTPEAVAVLGMGAMGRGMAHSALRAGLPTIVWNRTPEATRDLAEAGAQVADSAADAALRAGIVVTMVTDADAVLSLAREQGVLAALRPEAIWAQMSTIGVAGTDRLADLVRTQRRDVTFLDAPVAGSREPAERGELTIFASGPQEARSRITPLFTALGRRTIWVGPVGAGSRLKVVNNTWLAFASEAIVTSMAVARRLGLPTETVVDAFSGGNLTSPWQEAKLPRVAKGEYSPQFSLELALKDVRLALQVTNDDQFVALAGLAEEWQRALSHGLGEQDLTVVARTLEPQVTR